MRAALVPLVLVATLGSARADDVRPEAPSPGYRAELAIPDGIAAGIAVAAAADPHDQGTLITLAAITYVVGGPIVHLAHRHSHRALNSVAVRVGVPVVAAYLGGKLALYHEGCYTDRADACNDGNNEPGGRVLGALVGAVGAAALDSLLWGGRRQVQPVVAPISGGGMTFGIAGSL